MSLFGLMLDSGPPVGLRFVNRWRVRMLVKPERSLQMSRVSQKWLGSALRISLLKS